MRKNRIYILTFVDCATRCILAWKVSTQCNGTEFQDILAESVPGHDYFSDDYLGYKTVLYWPAIHYPMKDKSETCSVEGANADLRHYLARLRHRFRCFSRCEVALRNVVKLFVYAYNRRQLIKQQFPNHIFRLMDFSSP